VTVLNCKTIAARDKRKTKSAAGQSRARGRGSARSASPFDLFALKLELHVCAARLNGVGPYISLITERQHDRGGVSLGAAGGDQLPAQRVRPAVPQTHLAVPAEGLEQRGESEQSGNFHSPIWYLLHGICPFQKRTLPCCALCARCLLRDLCCS